MQFLFSLPVPRGLFLEFGLVKFPHFLAFHVLFRQLLIPVPQLTDLSIPIGQGLLQLLLLLSTLAGLVGLDIPADLFFSPCGQLAAEMSRHVLTVAVVLQPAHPKPLVVGLLWVDQIAALKVMHLNCDAN